MRKAFHGFVDLFNDTQSGSSVTQLQPIPDKIVIQNSKQFIALACVPCLLFCSLERNQSLFEKQFGLLGLLATLCVDILLDGRICA